MILDELPLELMREVLLDLPTLDVIQTVKCTRRLYHFAKVDKGLGRRLQGRVFGLHMLLSDYKPCRSCGELALQPFLETRFRRRENDGIQWIYTRFVFRSKDGCNCYCTDGRTQEIEPRLLNHPSSLYDSHLLRGFENGTKFVISNGSLDDVAINCGKLFNILMKLCVVYNLALDFEGNTDPLWDKMNAFFNANPPDVRIQPYVSINSKINLDSFLTNSIFQNGLAEIEIYNDFGPTLTNAYHEVFRKTPGVYFNEIDLPYTYEDLIGFFKDAKRLKLDSTTRITKQQICQVVQNFYEVKHDEECLFEIKINESFWVKDFLTLIPKKAYRLYLKRGENMGPEPGAMVWAEMTDKFGGTWAIMDTAMHYDWGSSSYTLRISNTEDLAEDSYQSDCYQSDSD